MQAVHACVKLGVFVLQLGIVSHCGSSVTVETPNKVADTINSDPSNAPTLGKLQQAQTKSAIRKDTVGKHEEGP